MKQQLIATLKKLNPLHMLSNPVIFVVELGAILLSLIWVMGLWNGDSQPYTFVISLILWLTILFANYAEALAEGRGRAQAESLRATRADTIAKRFCSNGSLEQVASTQLRKGDVILIEAGDLVPGDGEIIEGLASVDESAITGESAPVIKESGGDFSSVTGGTKVISDWIKVRITADPGSSFLDNMISLVEGSSRQKTPNEVALNMLLNALTLIFIMVIVTLVPIAGYVGVELSLVTLVALLVCLIPTTIGGLLSAIGIAGMNRVTKFNVLAMSGKAVEAAGDINTVILDKTGTITFGNRRAVQLIAVGEHSADELREAAISTSLNDETPEGRSVLELLTNQGYSLNSADERYKEAEIINFTAESRMSGIDLASGICYRKGAVDAMIEWTKAQGGVVPDGLQSESDIISNQGGTPLAVAKNQQILGLIYLKDVVKPGMRERFEELRRMGIKSIMATGDNRLTAATIAREAGVDDFIAESKPEDKINIIRAEQAQGKLVAMTGDGTNDAPALAQADVGLAMNSGTIAAKEAANMIDLDSDPTKIIEVVAIGKQLLMTRGALTTFSVASDVAKYFVVLPAIFISAIPTMSVLNFMHLSSPGNAVLAALIFNALIIPAMIPLAMRGVSYSPISAEKLVLKNLLVFGLGGALVPFLGIKAIDMLLEVISNVLY